MWLWYGWRAAAVADDTGLIHDSESWDGWNSISAVVSRLEIIANSALTPEAKALAERFPEARVRTHGHPDLPPADWPLPGEDALAALDSASLRISEAGVDAAAGDKDRRLEHLLRASDELRSSQITMEARLVEWVGLFLPKLRFEDDREGVIEGVNKVGSIQELAEMFSVSSPEEGPSDEEWDVIHSWAQATSNASARLVSIEERIKDLVNEYLPSTSLLLGPMLAARLCVEAHGRERLARLPSGTVQILGAEKAFFNHLKNGDLPPKHGHIFMHPWISRSPNWVRGKISRLIASKTSIAVRCDHFAGETWSQEAIEEIAQRVETIKLENPRPPRR